MIQLSSVLTAVLLLSMSIMPLQAAEKISLIALFEGKVLISVDGERVMLVKGQTGPDGIRLIATDTRTEIAKIEIDGETRALGLAAVVSGPGASATGDKKVVLYVGRQGFFHADGRINGISVRFLVDTGANVVALNDETARLVGIDYKNDGKRGFATTASGYAVVYNLELRSVSIGGITLRNIEASVIEGPQPATPLLGMSFLGNLDMKRQGERIEFSVR